MASLALFWLAITWTVYTLNHYEYDYLNTTLAIYAGVLVVPLLVRNRKAFKVTCIVIAVLVALHVLMELQLNLIMATVPLLLAQVRIPENSRKELAPKVLAVTALLLAVIAVAWTLADVSV
ncbi:hypothetical protein AB0368_07255 [Actinoplanes sp. NPDC051475]|uniref:hypothetical protein n=1 Tax=Actinoplanes sp. NPDC051475 TaxID=3157225 RepID=UPI00344E45D8